MTSAVFLTGAAGDIGGAIVARLASAGYSIIGLDKTPPTNDESFVDFLHCDLNQEKDLVRSCRRIKRRHGPLWAFVHCAGLYPIVPLSEYSVDLWNEVENVNLKSAFIIAQELRGDIARGGRIVLISSAAAHLGSRDIGYSATKAGILGLARGLAKSLAQDDILVNCICPGLISTQMSARMNAEHFSKTRSAIPLGRPGRPQEIAVCVSFLLDSENTYMTGASIDVNGGLYMS